MKFGKALGTLLLCALLIGSTVLTLVSGLLSFLILNPNYYKSFVPGRSYCDELRQRIGENLDHVAILYGLDEGVLTDVVTDRDIIAYTAATTDALFDNDTTDTLTLPAFPAEGFANYLRSHSSYSEQAIQDFSEDCAASVTEDLTAINVNLLVSGFTKLRNSRLAALSPILCLAALVLCGVLLAMLLMVHGDTKRAGSVCVWGSLFIGISCVFIPVSQFWLFDYIGRLNLSISAFRTILTGYLNAALYGSLCVLSVLLLIATLFLILACILAARGKRKAR